MPLADLTSPEEREGSPFDYPKLKLERSERARVNFIEKAPRVEYVHTLRAPEIQNGQVIMEQAQDRDGNPFMRPRLQFIGQHICLGEYDDLRSKGIAPEVCPSCALSQKTTDVQPPQRRFAAHIVHYVTREGGWEVTDPFSARLKAWAFPQRTFDILYSLQEEWGSLREHDLLLGPCENSTFQKFDIRAAKEAAWLTSDANKAFVVQLYKNNQSPYLDQFIGRRKSAAEIESDLSRLMIRARQARGEHIAPDPDLAPATADMDALLSAPTSLEPEMRETSPDEPVTVDADDLLEVQPSAEPAPSGDSKSFEEILGELDS
jgi:hypothetical protein